MNTVRESDVDQAALWNGGAGLAWVEAQELLDRLFTPFEKLLVEAVRARSGLRVLDVGCGTGSTTLAVARSLGANGRCVGVDISEPMIAAARARAERQQILASFVCADAQSHAFAPASVDTIISRFGVMFFDDSVRAFANLRRAARDGAQLQLVAWRSPAENPFMTAAERAVAAAGWSLIGQVRAAGATTVLLAEASVDGMCRPWDYQGFVFVKGRFAGTLSPALMDARTDGALSVARLLSPTEVEVVFVRYVDADPLCCPSRLSTVRYRIERRRQGPTVVPYAVETTSASN